MMTSALPSGIWTGGWIYFTAPLLGMLLAAQIHQAIRRPTHLACPEMYHGTKQRCIFCGQAGQAEPHVSASGNGAATRKVSAAAPTD